MEGTSMTPEMRMYQDAEQAAEEAIKERESVVSKYSRKYGSTEGEATEQELDELML